MLEGDAGWPRTKGDRRRRGWREMQKEGGEKNERGSRREREGMGKRKGKRVWGLQPMKRDETPGNFDPPLSSLLFCRFFLFYPLSFPGKNPGTLPRSLDQYFSSAMFSSLHPLFLLFSPLSRLRILVFIRGFFPEANTFHGCVIRTLAQHRWEK